MARNRKTAPAGKRALPLGALLFVLAAALYLPTLSQGFITLDDPMYVVQNRMVRLGLAPQSMAWAFSLKTQPYWHPLVWLSLMADASLFGLKAWGFHLTNLLLHAGSVALFYQVLRRATGQRWVAALAAGLLAVHPVHVESVAWITERKDVLSQFLAMLTFWAYLGYVRAPSLPRYLAVAGVFVLGLMSKPMLVTLPLVLLLLDYWPLGRTPWQAAAGPNGAPGPASGPAAAGQGLGGGLGGGLAPVLRLVLEKLPLLALSLGSAWMTLTTHEAARAKTGFPLSLGLANALVSYPAYLGKLICPVDLAIFYPFPDAVPAWKTAGAALALAGGFFLCLRLARTRPHLAVGWLWFVGAMAPVLKLYPHGLWYSIADRFLYFPALGLYLALAVEARGLHARLAAAGSGLARAVPLAVALVLAALAGTTLHQLSYWKTDVDLYRRALDVTERNFMAHNNLGDAYEAQGLLDEALDQYLKTLEINPGHQNALLNASKIYLKRDRLAQAASFLERALAADPGYGPAQNILGILRLKQNRPDEAFEAWTKAARQSPDSPETQSNLGLGFLLKGDKARAAEQFRQALALDPGYKAAAEGLRLCGQNP